MESSQAAPGADCAHPWCCGAGLVSPSPLPARAGSRAGQGAEPKGVQPTQALTEDDEEPDHKSHDGEDQPPVADGVIVWGGGEPGGVSPARPWG